MRPGPRGPGNTTARVIVTAMYPGGFNEAGAARPRKFRLMPSAYHVGLAASMRPGPRGPGNSP